MQEKVSHLQYADDTAFLCSNHPDNFKVIKGILQLVELISGLKVNFEKCGIYGVMNVQQDDLREKTDLMGCFVMTLPIRYIGMKVGVDHHKRETWAVLIQKVKSKLARWNGARISLGGKVTLIKSVLSAMPVYCLSFFLLAKQTIHELTKIQCCFLWGGDDENKKIHWVKWEEVCKKREDGGLGIRELSKFNWALVGKWVWRLLNQKGRLWNRILSSRYGELERVMVRRSSRVGVFKGSLWWRDMFFTVVYPKSQPSPSAPSASRLRAARVLHLSNLSCLYATRVVLLHLWLTSSRVKWQQLHWGYRRGTPNCDTLRHFEAWPSDLSETRDETLNGIGDPSR